MTGGVVIHDLSVRQRSVLEVTTENPFVLSVAIFASIGGFLFGYDQGVISGVLTMESFGYQFPQIYADPNAKGWFVSSFLLTAWFGSLLNGQITDKIGRRNSMIAAVAVFLMGSGLQAIAITTFIMFVGRIVAGLSVGMLTMVVPLYMAEISPPEIRGGLVVLQQMSITVGILVAFWIDYFCNYIGGTRCSPNRPYSNGVAFSPFTDVGPEGCQQSAMAWRLPLGAQMLPGAILGIGMFFMPYSPRWLLMMGKDEDALFDLARIRRKPIDSNAIKEEFIQIRSEVLFEQLSRAEKFGMAKGYKLEILQYREILSSKSSFKRVFIGSAIMFLGQFMGCNALIYYAPTIFAQLGLGGNTTSLLATGVYGTLNCLGTFVALILIDSRGRRILLMWGAVGTGVSLIFVAAIIGTHQDSLASSPIAAWLGVLFIYVYDVNFAYSWAAVCWVLPSEIFPLAIRAKGISITTSSTWMNNFIIGLASPIMLERYTYRTYIFFAFFCLVAFFFAKHIVPETRQKSLEDMDAVFGDHTAARDKQRLLEIAAGLEEDLTENEEEDRVQRGGGVSAPLVDLDEE
ncbi:general substrate transporter [Lipomyces arxii]|uniref:general substrate transporter n=1 Tax=Lipomyces arxii TaxID=56418 RepID=UPI0034CD4917